jgi:hypothetical protein
MFEPTRLYKDIGVPFLSAGVGSMAGGGVKAVPVYAGGKSEEIKTLIVF